MSTRIFSMKRPKAKGILRNVLAALMLLLSGALTAQEIDIGLFESTTPNQLEVRLRPDYQINGEAITNIVYTVRWNDPNVTINTNILWPYVVFPSGPPTPYNGWIYQIFISVPFSAYVNWAPGSENVVSTFSYSGSSCATFEIINDEWVYANYGEYYVSVSGLDRTGIIYEPVVNLGSEGGWVSGGGTIYLGENTGPLEVMDYSEVINTWQRSYNGGAWVDIPGTAGIVVYSEVPTLPGVWEYRAEVQKGTCPVDYSDPAVVNVIGSTVWTGNISDDWFNSGNWTFGVPDALTDAIIPLVDPNPYPLIDGDAHCYGMDIQPGASTWVGFDGYLTAHGNFNNDGDFLIESTPAGTGSFIDNGTITGSGAQTVERFISKNEWHYISPPISDGVSGTFFAIYLKEFMEMDSSWTYIVPVDCTLYTMQGYAIWAADSAQVDINGQPVWVQVGDTTVTYNGTLNTNTLSVEVTNHGGAAHNSKGFNFVGNPYPSAVDWERDDGMGWNRQNLDNTFYLWNCDVGNYGSYTKGNPNSGTNGVDSIIPAGAGFFIHVTDGNPLGMLEVDNMARLHSPKDIFKKGNKSVDDPYIRFTTENPSNGYSDEIIIQLSENATGDYDGMLDAYDLTGLSVAPQMYTLSDDFVKLAMNSLPDDQQNKTIPMGFKPGQDGLFTISADDILNLGEEVDILLIDQKENITTDLREQPAYSFESELIDEPLRFVLRLLFEPDQIADHDAMAGIRVFWSEGILYVKCEDPEILPLDISIFDMMGRNTMSFMANHQISAFNVSPDQGIYVVRVNSGKQSGAYKIWMDN